MSTAPAPRSRPDPEPQADPRFDPAEEFPRPPAEDFWEKYSGRLEVPMSWTGAVLVHVLVALLFFAAVTYLFNSGDRSGVPVVLVDVDGMDDEGEGRAGSGGADEQLFKDNDEAFQQAIDKLTPQDTELPKPNEDFAEASKTVAEQLAAKKAARGSQVGEGNEKGKGRTGQKGDGPGGQGNDDKWKRGDSWRLFFRFDSGPKYIEQLAGLDAVILVVLADGDANYVYVGDLKNPSVKRKATADDLVKLNQGWKKFFNQKANEVPQVCQVLGVTEPAKAFWVFLPPPQVEELARLELRYANKPKESIDETHFNVVYRGGKYQFAVFRQTLKK